MVDMNSQEDVDQWEALDLGDSELPTFLRPCKRKSPSRPVLTPVQQPNPKPGFNSNTNRHQTLRRCSSPDPFLEDSYSRPLIPGPAGVVQVAVRRKMNKDPKSLNEHGEPIPTQEFIRKAVEEPDWEDKDFSEDPWLSAVDYIRSEGLLSNGGNAIGTPLSEIKSECGSWGKYSLLLILLILVEIGCVAFIFFDNNWRGEIPSGRTGNFDTIYTFLRENWNIVRWVALGAVVFESLIERAANQQPEYDSDDEYIVPRQPFINRQAIADCRTAGIRLIETGTREFPVSLQSLHSPATLKSLLWTPKKSSSWK